MEQTPSDTPVLSPRAQVQQRLAEWIGTWQTAPTGVLTGLVPNPAGHGKARTITFGLAGTLDATVTIWSTRRFDVTSSRGESLTFTSEQALRHHCVTTYGAPEDVQP